MPAKKVGVQQDFQKIPVVGLVPESNAQASRPGSPVNGQLFYNQTTNRLEVYENGAWVNSSITGVELSANKGIAGGYAPLDGNADVPYVNLPVGTAANTVAAGNDSRFTDSRTPTGAAGGSLSGTYPNPGIAAGAVGSTEIAAAIKDAAAGTASLRTLGTGATQALAGNTRLDQLAAPTAPVALNGQKITGLADPTAMTDAATKGYVDGLQQGLDIKASVRLASVANVAGTYNATGGSSGRGQFTAMTNTLDGVSLAVGNRILLKDQTTGAQNGIWVVTTLGTGANGVWDRASDFDADAEVTAGAFTFVEEGTANADTGWVLATNNPITIGGAAGTALTWVQFSSAGQVSAGAGLTKTGSTIDVVGTANRITVAADSIDIASTYAGQTSITTLGTIVTGVWQGTTVAIGYGGTGATTAVGARANLGAVGKYSANLAALSAGVESVVTHNLNTTDVIAQFRNSSGYEEILGWRVIDANSIGVTADIAYAAAALRTTVMG